MVTLPRELMQKILGRDSPYIGVVTEAWLNYFTRMGDSINAANTRLNAVTLTLQSASLSDTDFSGGNLKTGLYAVAYTAQITRAAGTSSSLTVTFTWTRNGVTQTFQRAAITGNTNQTHDEFYFLIRADQNSPVSYATTYASVGAPTMQYALDIVLSQVQA